MSYKNVLVTTATEYAEKKRKELIDLRMEGVRGVND